MLDVIPNWNRISRPFDTYLHIDIEYFAFLLCCILTVATPGCNYWHSKNETMPMNLRSSLSYISGCIFAEVKTSSRRAPVLFHDHDKWLELWKSVTVIWVNVYRSVNRVLYNWSTFQHTTSGRSRPSVWSLCFNMAVESLKPQERHCRSFGRCTTSWNYDLVLLLQGCG